MDLAITSLTKCELVPGLLNWVALQVVCQGKKVVVAESKTSCEQLLVAIVQDKRIADEQEKQVRSQHARCRSQLLHILLIFKPHTV